MTVVAVLRPITPRAAHRLGPPDRGVSSPDQVAGGALSLGYAMTVAASQGLTTQVSLLYGHGLPRA